MKTTRTVIQRGARLVVIVPFASFLCGLSAAFATPFLGSADSFAVLGAPEVSDNGATTINGDLGVYPGSSIAGFGPIMFTGAVNQTDAVAHQAQIDAAIAYAALAALPVTTDLSGHDLGTVGTLTPGVYKFTSSAQLTGALTLDFAGNPDQPFVFQIGSALTSVSNDCVAGGDFATGRSDFGSSGFSGAIADNSTPVPEPASILLLGVGPMGIPGLGRLNPRRRPAGRSKSPGASTTDRIYLSWAG